MKETAAEENNNTAACGGAHTLNGTLGSYQRHEFVRKRQVCHIYEYDKVDMAVPRCTVLSEAVRRCWRHMGDSF